MRITKIILILSATISAVFSQDKFSDFQIGFLIPNDAKTGFIGGVNLGRMIDENIGWALELDYYGKTFTKETNVAQIDQGQIEPTAVATEIKNSTVMIPLFFKLIFTNQVAPNFDLRISGGIGYEFMWNSETNYKKNVDETRFYSGFAWQLGAGVNYPLSRASDLFVEAVYHGSSPSRSEGETSDGLPLRTEVDMSGLLFRIGVRIFNFGF